MSDNLNRVLSKLAIAHRNAAAAAMAEIGLHSGQAGVLFALWDKDGLSQAALGRDLGVAPPTVNVLVSKLEESGFVETRPCPNDGRMKRVYLTSKALGIRSKAEEQMEMLDRTVFKGFSELEKNTAMIVLSRLAENLSCTEPVSDHVKDRRENDAPGL
jgi:DNA-binding MarR family transcriptional regulator